MLAEVDRLVCRFVSKLFAANGLVYGLVSRLLAETDGFVLYVC